MIDDEIFMITYHSTIITAAGKSELLENDIRTHGECLEDWIKRCK